MILKRQGKSDRKRYGTIIFQEQYPVFSTETVKAVTALRYVRKRPAI